MSDSRFEYNDSSFACARSVKQKRNQACAVYSGRGPAFESFGTGRQAAEKPQD